MINNKVFLLKKDGTPYKRSFCSNPELIENYEKAINDKERVWDCHHRLELSPMGNVFSREYLKEQGLYYNVSADSLIFIEHTEHTQLHKKGNKYNRGRRRSDETLQKLSDSHLGQNAHNKGKKCFNNGTKNIYAYECPEGFIPGQLKRR